MNRGFTMFQRDQLMKSSCGNNRLRKFFSILIITLAAVPVSIQAQEREPILFHGIVIDSESREPLAGAHFRIVHRSAGATDSRGMVSFYARPLDTVIFSSVGYRSYAMIITDTLRAREYVAGVYLSRDTLLIPEVVVIPRLGNIRAEIMSDKRSVDQEKVNATNNLKISAWQGLTGTNQLGDPIANYEILRQKQRIDAYEKGGVPSDQMMVFSPMVLVPLIYVLAKGLPEEPEPPAPYISQKELNMIRAVHDSLIYGKKK